MLDLGRPEVVDHLADALTAVFAGAPISYVKWDMNRPITEPYSLGLPPERQGEMAHRSVLGMYELYRRLTERFPDILFESCASGGARFDPGLLAFAPQGWTSDDTDAIERLAIQWGTSLVYPLGRDGRPRLGRAQPPDRPGHAARDAGRRGDVRRVRLRAGSDRPDRRRADRGPRPGRAYTRAPRDVPARDASTGSPVRSIRSRRHAAWMVVAADGAEAIVGVYGTLNRPTPESLRVRLRGLDPAATYTLSIWPEIPGDPLAPAATGPRSGADLHATGLVLDRDRHAAATLGDFWARLIVLERR